MRIRKKPGIEVEATQLFVSGELKTNDGSVLKFERGHYLLTADDGDQWTVSAEYFAENYEAVPEY